MLATRHLLCFQCGFHDPDERAAAADVAVEPFADLLARRVGIFFQDRHRGDDEARRAEAAHQAVGVAERLLHRVHRPVGGGEAVDGANLLALHFDGERRARIDRAAVDDHRAGAAGAAIADALVAGEIGAIPDRVEQGDPRLDLQLEPLAVDHQGHRHVAGADQARAGLRLGDGGRGHRGRETGHAGAFQEISAADCHGVNNTGARGWALGAGR